MWPFRKEAKRPSRMYAAISLARMFMKADGTSYGMAHAIAIYQVTWNYENWTKEDDEWFWEHLEADNKALKAGE